MKKYEIKPALKTLPKYGTQNKYRRSFHKQELKKINEDI